MIPQSAFSKPAVGILPYIPLPNLDPATGLYSDDSQRNTVQDDKIGERVDFDQSEDRKLVVLLPPGRFDRI